jgi:hypothetical protein
MMGSGSGNPSVDGIFGLRFFKLEKRDCEEAEKGLVIGLL